MKFQAWKEKSQEERAKELVALKEKARTLRFDMASRQAKNVSDYRKLKKDIARLETLRRQEEVSVDASQE